MPETPFIITIDTEGDDLWGRPRDITTHNAKYLPRFQSLCERFRFKPVYLTNYEMAVSDVFVEFARDVIARDAGEIGMHLHAWNSPPLIPLTSDDFHHQPFLIEYPDAVMREKIRTMTHLLEDRFDRKMISHRAGRWAFDGRYAAMLIEEGYRVDCSVAPDMDWRGIRGDPAGNGGSCYVGFPRQSYFMDPTDISRPAAGALLEVPVTVRRSGMHRRVPWAYRVPLLRRYAHRMSIGLGWLCPIQPLISAPLGRNLEAMLQVARASRNEDVPHLEFVLHSSELMPGGSPGIRTESDIECLYEHLEMLFEDLATWCRGMTLGEFRTRFEQSSAQTPGRRDAHGVLPEPAAPRLALETQTPHGALE
jgi:hypothetical protein